MLVPGWAGAKVLRTTRIWDRLVSSSVIEEFGHKDVETTTTTTAPTREEMATRFEEPRDEFRVATLAASASERVRIEHTLLSVRSESVV